MPMSSLFLSGDILLLLTATTTNNYPLLLPTTTNYYYYHYPLLLPLPLLPPLLLLLKMKATEKNVTAPLFEATALRASSPEAQTKIWKSGR